jgi:tetraacyldisaccharide 4'-kinase
VLRLLGKLYGSIVDIRNKLYDRGLLKTHSLGARTISVGNLSFGGTGKTPLVALIAEIFADAGEKVCILTRGYGRNDPNDRLLVSDGSEVLADAIQAGDEPVELARQLVGKAVVVADADRVSAAAWARKMFNVTAFILDDGFQHRRAERDLDIVCVDANNPFGEQQRMLRGWLREPWKNIARADAIVITRSDLSDRVPDIVENVSRYNPTSEIFFSTSDLLSPRRLEDFLDDRAGGREDVGMAFAFAGLGNPGLFSRTLEFAGYALAGTRSFPDHMRYTQSDLDSIIESARERGATSLITTAKDAVKLGGLEFAMPCFVVEVRAKVDKYERFRQIIIGA